MSKGSELADVILVVGPNDHARRRHVERVREAMASLGELSLNHERFKGETAEGTDVTNAALTAPFLCERRLVEVEDPSKLKKPASEELIAYLEHPNPDTVLLLHGPTCSKNTRLRKAIDKCKSAQVLECAEVKAWDFPKAVRDLAGSMGCAISPEAAELLVELVGTSSLDHAAAELEKLKTACPDVAMFDVPHVRRHVAKSAVVGPFEVSNLLAERKVEAAWDSYLRGARQDPMGFLALLRRDLRGLMIYKSLERKGALNTAGAAIGCSPGKLKVIARTARLWNYEEIEAAYLAAYDLEMSVRHGADPVTATRLFMLSLAR